MIILICNRQRKGCVTVFVFNSQIKLDDCVLYAVADDCTVIPEDIKEKYLRLVVVKEGRAAVLCCDNEHVLEKGQCILAFPFEKIVLSDNTSGKATFAVVSFMVNSGKYSENLCGFSGNILKTDNSVISDVGLCSTVNNICLELKSSEQLLSYHLLSLLCSQMLIYLSRNLKNSIETPDSNDANLRVCGQVMGYIDNRIYSMKNLQEVATAIGYNYSYISTLFRKTVGVTLNAYFKTKRMNEAKKLLQDEKNSISEVARIMNYSSVYAFSKAFKEHFGSSPGHYSGRFSNKEL